MSFNGFASRKAHDKVMRRQRTGDEGPKKREVAIGKAAKAAKADLVGQLPDLREELATMIDAGEDQDAALGIIREELRAVSVDDLRRHGDALLDRLTSALRARAGFGFDKAVDLGSAAVYAAEIADRKAVLRHVTAKAKGRTWASPGEKQGFGDALGLILHNVDQGNTLDFGIQAHMILREVGDPFQPGRRDQAGFHDGAEQAYKEVRAAYLAGLKPSPRKGAP